MDNKMNEVVKQYPIINVPSSGHRSWMGGAWTMCFMYTKEHGNFILRGYVEEVEQYRKKNFTHYFCYQSMWHRGRSRGFWRFWKDGVGIYSPDQRMKHWKYEIIKHSPNCDKSIKLKRLPKRWIPEFDQF